MILDAVVVTAVECSLIGATLVRRSMPMSRNPKEKCEEMCSTGTRESETWKAKGGLPAEGFRTFVETFI